MTAAVRKGRDVAIGPPAPIEVSAEVAPGNVLATDPGISWPLQEMTVEIIVEASVRQAVILRDLRVLIDARRRPPDSTIVGVAAALPGRRFRVDLDQDTPQLVRERGTPGSPTRSRRPILNGS